MNRPYDNSRREQQAAENRQRILDAAVALLGDGDDVEFSMPAVARRAGVSVPTVYRNFPDRDALLDAVDLALASRRGAPTFPTEAAGIRAMIPQLIAFYERNHDAVRAGHRSAAMREVHEHGRRARDRRFAAVFAPETAHLPADEAHAVQALCRVLMGADAFLTLVDRFGCQPRAIASAVGWALDTLLQRLRDDRLAGRTTLTEPSP